MSAYTMRAESCSILSISLRVDRYFVWWYSHALECYVTYNNEESGHDRRSTLMCVAGGPAGSHTKMFRRIYFLTKGGGNDRLLMFEVDGPFYWFDIIRFSIDYWILRLKSKPFLCAWPQFDPWRHEFRTSFGQLSTQTIEMGFKILIPEIFNFLKIVRLKITYLQKENQSNHPYFQENKTSCDVVTSSKWGLKTIDVENKTEDSLISLKFLSFVGVFLGWSNSSSSYIAQPWCLYRIENI